jgi:hypothetical protein
MKLRLISSLAAALLVASAFAQAPVAQDTFIKGDLNIRFNTRQLNGDEKVRVGATDIYTLNINVANSSLLRGTIEARPYLSSTFGTAQSGQLTYALDLDVVNPKNPAQTRNVGKLFGTVPVDEKNVYRFMDGNVKVSVFPIGTAKGFDSKFGGLALGKPPAKSGFFATVKQDALSVVKNVKGQAKSIAVTKYDKMEFQTHVLPAGPVQIYPEVTVSGTMVYDYGRSAWYFQGVTASYTVDGKRIQDSLSGNIRWVEAANRKTSGLGEYQFDIRVNEPAPTEAAVFAPAADESAFFESDNTLSALVGTMKYKDSMVGDSVTSSTVSVDLHGNRLTKQQTMYLAKLLFLTSIVPLNAE